MNDRTLFKIGFIGLIMAICAIPASILVMLVVGRFGNIFGILCSAAGLCLASVAFLGYWRRYDKVIGLAVFIASVALVVPSSVYSAITAYLSYVNPYLLPPTIPLLDLLPNIIIGVMFLCWGIGLLIIGYQKSLGLLTLIAGALFLAFGVIFASVMTFQGMILTFAVGLYVILLARITGLTWVSYILLGVAGCLTLVIFKREVSGIRLYDSTTDPGKSQQRSSVRWYRRWY